MADGEEAVRASLQVAPVAVPEEKVRDEAVRVAARAADFRLRQVIDVRARPARGGGLPVRRLHRMLSPSPGHVQTSLAIARHSGRAETLFGDDVRAAMALLGVPVREVRLRRGDGGGWGQVRRVCACSRCTGREARRKLGASPSRSRRGARRRSWCPKIWECMRTGWQWTACSRPCRKTRPRSARVRPPPQAEAAQWEGSGTQGRRPSWCCRRTSRQ